MWQKQKAQESEGAFKGPTFSGQRLQTPVIYRIARVQRKETKSTPDGLVKAAQDRRGFFCKAERSFPDEEWILPLCHQVKLGLGFS